MGANSIIVWYTMINPLMFSLQHHEEKYYKFLFIDEKLIIYTLKFSFMKSITLPPPIDGL